jgi:chorismate synthase
VECSDVCAVPAAAVIGEAVVSFELARAVCEKFGGDSLAEIQRNHRAYLDYLASR